MTDRICNKIMDIKEEDYFTLTENFINQFKGKQPKWGPIGYVTYKRTYSRLIEGTNQTEEFWQSLKRVVETVYTIQKWHCRRFGLPFNGNKAQISAQTMYQVIWDFKFCPSRGMWGMHLPLLSKVGAGPLYNCGTVSTQDINIDFSDPFSFLMDFLMQGVGVSCDTRGVGKLTIKEPKTLDGTFVVDDTREGWVDAVKMVIDSFSGKGGYPKNIDYSQIRAKGEPLKTMGGIAPGPEPLKLLIKRLTELLINNIGKEINSQIITDIADMVGVCVVSGNIRRSAILMLGDFDDEDFMDLKNSEKHPNETKDYRWASNNTIKANKDIDYNSISKRAIDKGEIPGLFFMENAKQYGRFADGENYSDTGVVNVNPCLVGDSMIYVADGRGYVKIKDLADKGLDVPVFSFNERTRKPEVKLMRNPRVTGYQKKIVKVLLDDGSFVRCTEDHKFYLKNGETKQAKELSAGEKLHHMVQYNASFDEVITHSNSRSQDYRWINTGFSQNLSEHRLIAEFYIGRKLRKGEVVHHIDRNGLNNKQINLDVQSKKQHDSLHVKNMFGANNPMCRFPEKNHFRYKNNKGEHNGRFKGYTPDDVFSHAVFYSADIGRRVSKKEWKKYCVKNDLPQSIYSLGKYKSVGAMLRLAAIEAGLVDLKNSIHVREYKKFIELKKNGNTNVFFKDGCIYTVKKCEICATEFVVKWSKREKSFCSNDCVGKYIWSNQNIKNKILDHYKSKQQKTREQQISIYDKLKNSLNRDPLKIEWENLCKKNDISFRLRYSNENNKFNEYCFTSYNDLKNASSLNFKVVSVLFDGYEDVYNGTVDDNHNLYIMTSSNKTKSGKPKKNNILSPQCGEISLENRELCNVLETFPVLHESYEDYEKTLKYAYLYATTVTLIPTNNMRTNAVMMKNRRIGISQSGVIQSFNKFGRREHFRWCNEGYKYLRGLDERYSDWLAIPRSKKITTIKPSGTISLLPGVTAGIHYPPSEYYYKLMRISKLNPIIKNLKNAGYKIEPLDDKNDNDTMVVYFPIKCDHYDRSEKDVSIWEQLENTAQMQYWWSDNAVSVTIKFKKEEIKEIENALELYESRLKSVSFLPSSDHHFKQPPWMPITKQEYEESVSNIKKIRKQKTNVHDMEEKYCSGDSCMIEL